MKQRSPSTDRNKEPLRLVLERVLPEAGTVLEIASGTGEHAVHFARAFPGVAWQPTDVDATARASIEAWLVDAALPNLRAPLALDVTAPWPVDQADAVVCINMIHISPWEATLALFAGAARVLSRGGLLFLYGPYKFDGEVTAPSNAEFDRSLRARDSRWGVRDVTDLQAVAAAHGFVLRETIGMPANNHALVFRRT